jgi:hypothetical protein
MIHLSNHLSVVPDHRRPQGRMYDLGAMLLFSILAVLSGATSYRKIAAFIAARLDLLNTRCGLAWRRAPAHNSIRYALLGLNANNLEAAFRAHAAELHGTAGEATSIAIDGKVLRGSFNGFEDRKAAQIVSALATESTVVLGHVVIHDGDKDHELAAAQRLIEELGLTGQLFTLDALHAQKKRLSL